MGGIAIAFQINKEIGIVDDSTDLIQALQARLGDLLVQSDNRRELFILIKPSDQIALSLVTKLLHPRLHQRCNFFT